MLNGIVSCDHDFPVPPASIVPKFTYVADNDGTAPSTVTFTNTSIVPTEYGAPTYTWNFGDNTTSTETNPVHRYENPGVYQVSLVIVATGTGQIKTITQAINIKNPDASGVPIYFTNSTQVLQAYINDDAPVFEVLPVTNIKDSYGICIDTIHDVLYIADLDGGAIIQTDLNGKNQKIWRSGLDSPSGMAIDYEKNELYWDTSNGIQKGDLNSDDVNQKVDFITGQTNDPDGIAIDPVNRNLYWINYDGGLGMKGLDGSGEKILIPDAEGARIIVVGNRIYFDYYNGSGDIHIKSANLDGSNLATLATGISRVVYGLAYDPYGNKIYWGDRNKGQITRADLDGSNVQTFYTAAGSTPRGIVFGKKK
ncbi:MAG: PKD domain-containing protein [Saprospiraceae bacterium]|nr:PKD domain-containing protein [Candidatus Parvibacillus calidus]